MTPPPPRSRNNLTLTRLFLGMVVGISAVIYLGFLPSSYADLKPTDSGNRPTRQSTGIEYPNLSLEYYGEETISYLFDTNNHYTNAHTIQAGMSIGSQGSLQICGTDRTCTNGTPDEFGNYFDGTKLNTSTISRGGELASGDTDFWITKHRTTTNRLGATINIRYLDQAGEELDTGTFIASWTEIGFQDNIPIIGQLGTNQYRIRWVVPTRLAPNEHGLIEHNSPNLRIHDRTTYWIQTADNQQFTSPQETQISARSLRIKCEAYEHTITHTHQTTNPIYTRIRYQETRSGENYNIYSQPTTYEATPTELPQTPTNLRASSTLTQITLTWDPITSETPLTQTQTRYKFQGDPWSPIFATPWANTPNPTDTTIAIPNLQTNRCYTFQLRATNTAGDSHTTEITVSTSSPAPPPPPPPPPAPAPSDGQTPTDESPTTTSFTDSNGHTHETNIIALAEMGVTRGCNPPTNNRFCPDRAVTRAEMATFLVRAFELPTTDDDPFTDTQGNVHRPNINRMAAAGISRGCNPPTNNRFCPNRAVTRAEMATFMTRVLELDETGDTDFGDTTGNVHATNIRRFAEAGITRGCNPPENSRYCPERAVTRAEMATFLVRATNLNNG